MLKNVSICLAALVIASVAWAATPSTQLQVGSMPICRHADNPTQADRDRASQAAALAKRINAAESDALKRSGKYEPVASLRALPTTPDGFKIYLYVDGTGYLFSLKDTLDPCHFAIFSDTAGLVYQQSALTAPVVAKELARHRRIEATELVKARESRKVATVVKGSRRPRMHRSKVTAT